MNLKERRKKYMEGFGKGREKCCNKIIPKVEEIDRITILFVFFLCFFACFLPFKELLHFTSVIKYIIIWNVRICISLSEAFYQLEL